MTNHKSKLVLILAAATGLFVLAASSIATAGPSIAPFKFQVKSKIYTFFYPTVSSYTFLGSKNYSPKGQHTTTGYNYTTNPSGVLSGPVVVHASAGQYYVSNYYAFNPYMGAQHSPGFTSGQKSGINPDITQFDAVAVLGGNAPPDFTVQPSQIFATGSGYVSPAGPYLGTTSAFTNTNATFDLGKGEGPGSTTFTAASASEAGQIIYTAGAHQFGGTMNWLGQNQGSFLTIEASCAATAVSCYHINTFLFPASAAGGTGDVNIWVDIFNQYKVNVFTASKTTALTGSGVTAFTTVNPTTGTVKMSQPDASFPTIFTVTGSDNRTLGGAGNITLVAGWLGHTFTSGTSHWGGYTITKFVFADATAAPSLASPALGALGGLMGIAAVYVIRKRSARN